MSVIKSITPLTRIFLPSSDLFWEHESAWKNTTLKSVSNLLLKHSNTVLRPPLSSLNSQQAKNSFALIKGESVVGWAEIHSYSGTFTQSKLIFEINVAALGVAIAEVLNCLVSATFIAYKADQLKLISLNNEDLSYLSDISHQNKILTISGLTQTSPRGRYFSAVNITKVDWLKSSMHKKLEDTFRHVISRERRLAHINKKASSQKKRGFLARILRPRVEDGIF